MPSIWRAVAGSERRVVRAPAMNAWRSAGPDAGPRTALPGRWLWMATCVLAVGWVLPAAAAAAHNDVAAGPPAALRPCLAARNGIDRPADPAAARLCLRRVAETGEPAAMFLLAQMLMGGEGGARDDAAARAWLERAAEQDYPEALQALALAEPDPVRSEGLMRAAAHALAHRAHETREVRRAARE